MSLSSLEIDFKKQEKEIIYEGMFVNGFYHGMGRLSYPDGTYFYGNFRNGKKYGNIISYDSDQNSWFQYEKLGKDDIPKFISDGTGYPPYYIDGYKNFIDNITLTESRLEDPDFKPQNFLLEEIKSQN